MFRNYFEVDAMITNKKGKAEASVARSLEMYIFCLRVPEKKIIVCKLWSPFRIKRLSELSEALF